MAWWLAIALLGADPAGRHSAELIFPLHDKHNHAPGVALSGPIVEADASGEESALKKVAKSCERLGTPLAVRSSAVDEDGAEASFAGQHLTLLNVPSAEELSSTLPVRDRGVGVRRPPDLPDGRAHVVDRLHVEQGEVLAGEARVGAVLVHRRGAHR